MGSNNKEYNRAWYLAHADERRLAASQLRKANKLKNRLIVQKYKTITPCFDCGVNYDPCVMEFDHIGLNKHKNVADLVSEGASTKKVMEEIDKCELVCSNCHRLRTCSRSTIKTHMPV